MHSNSKQQTGTLDLVVAFDSKDNSFAPSNKLPYNSMAITLTEMKCLTKVLTNSTAACVPDPKPTKLSFQK